MNLVKEIKKYIFRHRIKSLFILILLIFLVSIIFLFYYQSLSDTEKVSKVRSSFLVQKILPVWRSIKKTTDIFYLPAYFKKHNLETYQLNIQPDILKKMKENLPPLFSDAILTAEFKKWWPAELITPDNQIFEVEVRYRGDNSIHWDSRKKSIAIDFKKDDAYKGMKKINFIIPRDREFVLEHVHMYQSKKINIPQPFSGFALLKINNRKQGLYFITQGWDSSFLAKNNLSEDTNLFGIKENILWFGKKDDIFDDLRQWKKYARDAEMEYSDYSYIDILLQAINQWPDDYFYQHIFDLIDEDNFFNWLVPQSLAGSIHQPDGDLRIVFDNIAGKFKFISWNIGIYSPIFDPYTSISKILLKPENMHKKNLLLWDYLNKKGGTEDDIDFFDKTWDKIKTGLYQDRHKIYSNLYASKQIKSIKKLFLENINFIKEKLETARALVYYKINPLLENNLYRKYNLDLILEIVVDNPADLIINKIDINELNLENNFTDYLVYYDQDRDKKFSSQDLKVGKFNNQNVELDDLNKILLYSQREAPDNQGDPLIIKKTTHTFFIVSSSYQIKKDINWHNLKIQFRNAVTDKKLKEDDVQIKRINQQVFSDFDLISADWQTVKNKNPFLYQTYLNNSTIVFPAGNYYIAQSFIIPKNYHVDFKPGAKLFLNQDASIFSYSPITAVNALFAAQNPKNNWGSFVVIDVKDKKSIFKKTTFEYGGQSFINGISSTGMLSLFESNGEIINNTFRYAQADDGLNIKKADVHISNNTFFQNSSDALDLDFCTGQVSNNFFIDNGNDALDISGSKLTIIDNSIQGSEDKGISIGEKSGPVIVNNLIINNKIGIEVKDLSKAIIINNTIADNEIGINEYQKKEIFGPGQAEVYNSIIWNNGQQITLDNVSEIQVSHSLVQGGWNGDDIIDMDPEFDSDYKIGNQEVNKVLNQDILKEYGLEEYGNLGFN